MLKNIAQVLHSVILLIGCNPCLDVLHDGRSVSALLLGRLSYELELMNVPLIIHTSILCGNSKGLSY